MHRFYLPPENCRGDTLTLDGREAHHAIHVLRVRGKEGVVVLNGVGLELHCEVSGLERKSLTLQVAEQKAIPPLPCAITLLQAIPKGKLIESIIQKATELGVARIVPILSERVLVHLDSDGAEAKAEKWQQIAIEAIKQCGSAWLPKVEPPVTIEKFIACQESFELPLVGCLESDSRHPRIWFDQFLAEQQRMPRSVGMWVGPEGDFTPAEYSSIKAAGAKPITLGPLVLRVETAATYCLSVLNYELQAPR
ncbi:MAG TPA: RsmE family RNA methyltransferase [Candidatus Limnocylindria bacterium]|nr:RsmE family RNA methyltransferase [Candidatus Limnocylindria bacterium]